MGVLSEGLSVGQMVAVKAVLLAELKASLTVDVKVFCWVAVLADAMDEN